MGTSSHTPYKQSQSPFNHPRDCMPQNMTIIDCAQYFSGLAFQYPISKK